MYRNILVSLIAGFLLFSPLSALATGQESDLPVSGEEPLKVTGAESIVFGEQVPTSVFRTVTTTDSCQDVEIFARDCCIRDDVVQIYVNGCRLGTVDSRGGDFGTHAGATLTVSLAPGTYQIEYRNTVSSIGASGWEVSEGPAATYTGRHPCGGLLQSFNPFSPGDACGEVSQHVLLRQFMDDAGNSIRLYCKDQNPFVDEFRLEYFVVGESTEKMIGRCPYEQGCNSSTVYHTGDLNRNNKPDCFVASRYTSEDQKYGDKDDDGDGKKDSIYFEYDAVNNLLSESQYDRNSPPELVFFGVAEPGPEDPFFAHIVPDGGPMRSVVLRACDLDGNGECTETDELMFEAAFGSCRGEPAFEPLADLDGSGCITEEDAKLAFTEVFSDGFEKGDTSTWSQSVGGN